MRPRLFYADRLVLSWCARYVADSLKLGFELSNFVGFGLRIVTLNRFLLINLSFIAMLCSPLSAMCSCVLFKRPDSLCTFWSCGSRSESRLTNVVSTIPPVRLPLRVLKVTGSCCRLLACLLLSLLPIKVLDSDSTRDGLTVL